MHTIVTNGHFCRVSLRLTGMKYFDLYFFAIIIIHSPKPNICAKFNEDCDLSCITSCLVLVGFLIDTLLNKYNYMIVLLYIYILTTFELNLFLVPANKVIPYIEWGLCVPATCSDEDVGVGFLDIVEIACKFLGSTDLKYWCSFK